MPAKKIPTCPNYKELEIGDIQRSIWRSRPWTWYFVDRSKTTNKRRVAYLIDLKIISFFLPKILSATNAETMAIHASYIYQRLVGHITSYARTPGLYCLRLIALTTIVRGPFSRHIINLNPRPRVYVVLQIIKFC